MSTERLLQLAEQEGIEVVHSSRIGRLAGMYVDKIIVLNPEHTKDDAAYKCILAEELGHYFTSVGDIRNQNDLDNRSQERQARAWSYEVLMPMSSLINAFNEGVKNRYELAIYLNVTETFIEEGLKYYREKYGVWYRSGTYFINLETLAITKFYE